MLLLLLHSPACSSADGRLVPIGVSCALKVLQIKLLLVSFLLAVVSVSLDRLRVVELPLAVPVSRLARHYAKRSPLILLALVQRRSHKSVLHLRHLRASFYGRSRKVQISD